MVTLSELIEAFDRALENGAHDGVPAYALAEINSAIEMLLPDDAVAQ